LEPITTACQAIAKESGILFTMEVSDELPGVTVCPEALQEACSNVLDNAMKYVLLDKVIQHHSKNSNPHVHLRILPNHKPMAAGVTIIVEDNGPGIPKEERTKVLERGYRSKSMEGVIPGSGIGLNLAKSMIEEMDGTISIVDPTFYDNALDGTIVQIVLFR
jgi:signal transduction histidine kinase